MPKVNIYLPETLLERVKQFKLPVSSICQSALSDVLAGIMSASHVQPANTDSIPEELALPKPLTQHAHAILLHAYRAAGRRGSASVESEDLLQGVIDEGESLLLALLEQCGFSRQLLQRELSAAVRSRKPGIATSEVRLSATLRSIIAHAADDAVRGASPSITASHLFFAVLDTGDNIAARILTMHGIEKVLTRDVVALVHTGNAFGIKEGMLNQPEISNSAALRDIIARLDRLERRLASS